MESLEGSLKELEGTEEEEREKVYREICQVKRPVPPLFCPVSLERKIAKPTESQMDRV